MIRILSIIGLFISAATSSIIIPIRWTDDCIPEISISVDLPDNTTVNGYTVFDLSSPMPFTVSHESFDEGGAIAQVKLSGADNQNFQFESRVIISNRQWELISGLDSSPNTPFANAAGSFMITPTSLVIQPIDNSRFCSNTSVLNFFHGRVYHENTWSFLNQVSGRAVFIDSAVNSLTLSESAYDEFVEEVLDFETIEVFSVTGTGMVVPNCDVEYLDTIFPVFQYTILGENDDMISIELSAKQYLIRPSHDNVCVIAIEIADDPNLLHLGAVLFQKYSLIFDNNSGRIGICEAAVFG